MTILESAIVSRPKHTIEFDVAGYDVVVVASRLTEEGYELILEGEAEEVYALLVEWGEASVLSQ